MPLPSSGAISLNQMHTEVGGTSGTTVGLNDSDVRGLISKASGAQMSFNEWYGASAVSNWSATLTVGYSSAFKIYSYGYFVGDFLNPAMGSLTDTTVDNYSGSPSLHRLLWSTTGLLNLQILGNLANSGWSTLTIGSTTFSRTSATYSYVATPNVTQWFYTGISTSPMGSSGGTRSVSLT
jgi:hypothetical protein